jgi:hypothetical protein
MGRVSRHKVLGQALNHWQVSGIVQWQSGVNMTGQRGQNFGMTLNNYVSPSTGYRVSNTALLGTPHMQLNPILTCNPTENLAENQFLNVNCFSFPKNVGENGPTVLPAWYGPAYFNGDLGVFKNFRITEKIRVRFDGNAFNVLNHPLWSFATNQLQLGFNGTTAVNTPQYGTVTQKLGRRIMQLKRRSHSDLARPAV